VAVIVLDAGLGPPSGERREIIVAVSAAGALVRVTAGLVGSVRSVSVQLSVQSSLVPSGPRNETVACMVAASVTLICQLPPLTLPSISRIIVGVV